MKVLFFIRQTATKVGGIVLIPVENYAVRHEDDRNKLGKVWD